MLGASLLATSCNHGIKDRTFREQVKKDFEAKMKLMGNQFFDLASVGKISQPEKEALEFLYAYMPLADVTDYSTKFYLDNVRIGFSCLADTPWGKDISEPLFYHYVMPLRVSDENLDSSRVEFHHTLQPMLEGKDIKQAILDINHWCAEKAACQPTGTRTCSPMTCILNAEGNEEETSILLVNALRSVGIPARMTYREVAKDSLIYRVEAWGQDGWYAMTSCKPEPALTPVGLDGQTWTTKVFGFYGPHAAAEEKIKVQDIYYAVVDIDLKFNPKASKPKAPRVTAQMEAKNDTLMAKAKRIRDAYVSTFITFKEASGYADLIRVPYLQAAPILVNSKGNINTVKLFLHDYPDNRALEIIEDLTIEDLKDVKMDVLMDSYDTKLSARKPKVGNEYLTPYKKYFLENLPDSLKPIVKGGGSLTALPIIETQAGDVSAYIPTNVISITDGQIFLESDLFNSGVRPAINVGISVSRVGGNAQIKSMKKVSGTLKLDQAQYKELEAFAKFGSDLDASTLGVISKGERNVEILKQPVNSPLPVDSQVAMIYAGTENLLRNIPIRKVKEFQKEYVEFLRSKHPDTMAAIKAGKIDDSITGVLKQAATELASKYN